VVPYSNLHSLTSPPLGLTVAFSVAVVCVIEEAAFGHDRRGVGERFERFVRALARAAGVGRRDPEVVGGVRGEARDGADTATALVPDPGSEEHGAVDLP
jgi:hypothetical protein